MRQKLMYTTVVLVLLLVLPATHVSADAKEGLVGWWSFDEGTGTVAIDSSGNGHDGTLVDGPTWIDGQYGSALEFTSSSDRVDVPPEVFDTIDQQCTMTFWAFGADALPVTTIAFRAVDGAGQRQWGVHLPWSNGEV